MPAELTKDCWARWQPVIEELHNKYEFPVEDRQQFNALLAFYPDEGSSFRTTHKTWRFVIDTIRSDDDILDIVTICVMAISDHGSGRNGWVITRSCDVHGNRFAYQVVPDRNLSWFRVTSDGRTYQHCCKSECVGPYGTYPPLKNWEGTRLYLSQHAYTQEIVSLRQQLQETRNDQTAKRKRPGAATDEDIENSPIVKKLRKSKTKLQGNIETIERQSHDLEEEINTLRGNFEKEKSTMRASFEAQLRKTETKLKGDSADAEKRIRGHNQELKTLHKDFEEEKKVMRADYDEEIRKIRTVLGQKDNVIAMKDKVIDDKQRDIFQKQILIEEQQKVIGKKEGVIHANRVTIERHDEKSRHNDRLIQSKLKTVDAMSDQNRMADMLQKRGQEINRLTHLINRQKDQANKVGRADFEKKLQEAMGDKEAELRGLRFENGLRDQIIETQKAEVRRLETDLNHQSNTVVPSLMSSIKIKTDTIEQLKIQINNLKEATTSPISQRPFDFWGLSQALGQNGVLASPLVVNHTPKSGHRRKRRRGGPGDQVKQK